MLLSSAVVLSAFALVLQAQPPVGSIEPSVSPAAALKEHARFLASDSLGGRAPGSVGGARAAQYIAEAFRSSGLEPPEKGRGFLQPVSLVGSRAVEEGTTGKVVGPDGVVELSSDQLVARSAELGALVEREAPVVFAGYGISGAEYGWDDYAGLDVRGRIVALLEGFPEEASALLPGGADGYFEMEQHKLAAAAARGATAVVFLAAPDRERRFAGRWRDRLVEQLYPGWQRPSMPDLVAWLSPQATGVLLKQAGREFDDLHAAASRAEARAVDLGGVSLSLRFCHHVREFYADNVVGILPGSGQEVVVVTAHYDGLGLGPADELGDTIYNGGRDNASGVAALLILADEISKAAEPPQRSLVFVATTAEETDSDQLGAQYHLQHPARPLTRTVLNLNLDGINVFAPSADVVLLPSEGLEGLDPLERLIADQGLIRGSLPYEAGLHFSFDTKSFLERELPGVTVWMGDQHRAGSRTREELVSLHERMGSIHAPSDEFLEDWNEEAIDQHLDVYRSVLLHVAGGGAVPHLAANGLFAPLIANATAADGVGPKASVEPPVPARDDIPVQALAARVVEQMALKPGERVMLICRSGHFDEMVRVLRYELMRAGAADLGCLEVIGRPYPEAWGSDVLASGLNTAARSMVDWLELVDAFVVMPGAWPTEPAYAAAQGVLRREKRRAVHFHWHGAYDLTGRQLQVDRRIDRVYTRAVLETDLLALAAHQEAFVRAARDEQIRVVTPAGTDLRFRIGERPVTIQDGDASAERADRARNLVDREVEIPAGAVRVAPLEDSVSGVVVFPRSRWDGVMVEEVRLTFRQGKVTELDAAGGGAEAVRAELDGGGAAARSFREFALGFNPLLAVPEKEPFIPYYGYGAGVVRLSLGDNSELGGAVRGGYTRWNFFTDATVTVGETVWVRDGELLNLPDSAQSQPASR